MKKNIYFDKFFLRNSFRTKVERLIELKFWSKRSIITSYLPIGTRLQVYNGSKFINIIIERDMQGIRVGELCFTKHLTSSIHSKSIKAKSKK